MSKHSPEPWKVGPERRGPRPGDCDEIPILSAAPEGVFEHRVVCGYVVRNFSKRQRPTVNANIHRIVACVNALAEIPDEALPELNAFLRGPARSRIIRMIVSAVLNKPKEKPMCDKAAKEQAEAVKELVGTEPAKGERSRNQELRERLRQSEELTELAWGLIANAYGGDWDLASEASGWRAAAERWRDAYHKTLPDSSSRAEAPVEGAERKEAP